MSDVDEILTNRKIDIWHSNLERQKLTYVELPNLLHRILSIANFESRNSKEVMDIVIDEIKKVTNAECQSALDKKKLG